MHPQIIYYSKHPKPIQHGTHRGQRQTFTHILRRVDERKSTSFTDTDSFPIASKQPCLSSTHSCSNVLFPAEKCDFWYKETIKVKTFCKI